MSRVLIIAEHLNGQLNGATARCVSCAAALNADAMVGKDFEAGLTNLQRLAESN